MARGTTSEAAPQTTVLVMDESGRTRDALTDKLGFVQIDTWPNKASVVEVWEEG